MQSAGEAVTTKDEFYRWWSGLTNDERVSCWYDIDAMAHGEVLVALRDKLAVATSRIAEVQAALVRAEAKLEMVRVAALGSTPGCRPFDEAADALKRLRVKP